MLDKRIDDERSKQPVFKTETPPDPGEKPRKGWFSFTLKAILSVDVHDDVQVKPLSDADVDDCCRGALAGGLTPRGLGSPFDH